METTKEVLQGKVSAAAAVLYMAQELSGTKWKLALSAGGTKVRRHEIDAGDRAQLLALIEKRRISACRLPVGLCAVPFPELDVSRETSFPPPPPCFT
mgnify:CR=1 FL=1